MSAEDEEKIKWLVNISCMSYKSCSHASHAISVLQCMVIAFSIESMCQLLVTISVAEQKGYDLQE